MASNLRRMFLVHERPPIVACAHGCSGKTYEARPGQLVDVPFEDAGFLSGNGWCFVDQSMPVGPSSQRPRSTPNTPAGVGLVLFGERLEVGQRYLDTSVDAILIWTGAAWVDVVTGKAV